MRILAIAALSCLFVTGCPRGSFVMIGETPQQRLDQAIDKLAKATTEDKRFYALEDVSKLSFELGKVEVARKYARELLTLLPKFKQDWNYGNAVQDDNLLMGRIALREGQAEDAKQ